MSKAFTSEENEDEGFVEPPALPPGTKNYITVGGATKLRAELDHLLAEQRRWRSSELSDQAQAQKIERRLRFLHARIETFTPIDPAQQPKDRVLFGATVTVVDAKGEEQAWRIVGLDETDIERGWISWTSPLAQALLEKQIGDVVPFRDQRYTIRRFRYEDE